MSSSEHKAWLKIERDALAGCVDLLKRALIQKEGVEAGSKDWRAVGWKLMELAMTFHYLAEEFSKQSPNECGSAEGELATVRRRMEYLGLMLSSFSMSLHGTARHLVEEMRNCVCAAANVAVRAEDYLLTPAGQRQDGDGKGGVAG